MKKLRVAAYCRVSTDHEEQESSLETQISYYGKLITEREGWQLVKIYAERATGTQMKKRLEFMKMIKACKQGREPVLHGQTPNGSEPCCVSIGTSSRMCELTIRLPAYMRYFTPLATAISSAAACFAFTTVSSILLSPLTSIS